MKRKVLGGDLNTPSEVPVLSTIPGRKMRTRQTQNINNNYVTLKLVDELIKNKNTRAVEAACSGLGILLKKYKYTVHKTTHATCMCQ